MFIDTAPAEIYTLSLHDALPIWRAYSFYAIDEGSASINNQGYTWPGWPDDLAISLRNSAGTIVAAPSANPRSEEHTSELQSRLHLVCRLLLEKKKQQKNILSPLI